MFLISSQCFACGRFCTGLLDALLRCLGGRARELIDAWDYARSADRDVLQELLAFIAAARVQFCLVHKLDRFDRNRTVVLAVTEDTFDPTKN